MTVLLEYYDDVGLRNSKMWLGDYFYILNIHKREKDINNKIKVARLLVMTDMAISYHMVQNFDRVNIDQFDKFTIQIFPPATLCM